jgi:DNA polymerase I
MAPRHVFLVDGSGFIFRAYHAIPPLSRPDGTPVNAVYGFVTMLTKLLSETEADHIAVIFDSDRRLFRNDVYADYKANRPAPPDDLVPQFALVREATRAFNIACVEKEGYEADDLIATYTRLARMAGAEVTIVSSDKDLMQLVGDGVRMYDAMKSRVIGPEEVREKFCVGPEKVIDVQALAGDSTDNVPGVPGIGIKTAGQLIEQFGDLETLLARAGEIKQPKRRQSLIEHADAARMSKQLVTLHDDLTVPQPLASFAVRKPDLRPLRDFLEAQSFKTLISRLDAVLAKGGTPGAAEETLIQHENYELVEDEEALQRWVAAAMTAGAVAIDTETTSLNVLYCTLVGVSLALERGRACYIPLGHRRPGGEGGLSLQQPGQPEDPRQIPMATALAILKPLLEDPSVLKIGQNIKYDMQVLARYGIHLAPFDDTMILSYVLESGLHGHGMDELAQHFLGIDTIKYSDVTGSGKSQVRFDAVPVDKACAYAAEDADVTWRLHQVLKPRLVSEHLVSVYETIERPLIPVLAAMEQRGIRVDADELKVLSGDFEARLDTLALDIHRLAGHPFNIGSPKQLGDVLFVEMGLAGGKKMKTGAYATGADVLEALAAEGHDLPARVLDWRQLAKLKSTYTDALIGEINPETGRVHTSFAQAVAITGRLSSSDPNLQNIPIRTEEGRKIRRAFVADEGFVLLSADYSQIELRLLAHVAAIDALKGAFREGIDIHALTASQVFGTPVEGMDPFVRRKAKAINFGIIYGISPFGLARQLGISRGEAGAYIDAYFARYPGIRDYMERTRAQAREQGFVTTLFGRRCHIRGLTDRNPSVRSFAERLAINAPIQGGAADIIKRAMIRVASALRKAGLQTQMLLQVHDELLFEVPHDEVEQTKSLVTSAMESAAVLDVPLVVDIGVGRSWADAH